MLDIGFEYFPVNEPSALPHAISVQPVNVWIDSSLKARALAINPRRARIPLALEARGSTAPRERAFDASDRKQSSLRVSPSARARVYLARVIRRTKRTGAGWNFRKLKRVIIARGRRVLSRVNARERGSDFTGS